MKVTVAEDDNPVSDNTFSRSGSVQTDLTSFTGYRIRLKPFTVIEIADHNLFIREYSCLFEDRFIYSDTSLIRKVRLCNGCNMNSCCEQNFFIILDSMPVIETKFLTKIIKANIIMNECSFIM